MSNIDNILLNGHASDNNAYKVPEGYFNDLHSRIMQRVAAEDNVPVKPVKKKDTIIRRLHPQIKYTAAACVVGAVLSVGSFMMMKDRNVTEDIANNNIQQSHISEQYVNDCLEYAMIDNDDIYSFLDEE